MATTQLAIRYEGDGISGEKLREFAQIIPPHAVAKVSIETEPDHASGYGAKKTFTKLWAAWE